MIYIKKILAVTLSCLMLLSLAACNEDTGSGSSVQESSAADSSGAAAFEAAASDTDDGGQLSVVTTIFPPYDFTREIAGDNISLKMLLPPGSESHSFEPTPQDIITVQECDVFIYTGGESDTWVDTILNSMDTSGMTILKMMDMVETVEEEIVEGMENDEDGHSHGTSDLTADEISEEMLGHEEDGDAEYDEHVWTSPVNAQIIVSAISEALIKADPDNAGTYEENTASYILQLKELDADFREVADNAQRHTIIFGDRFPLRYFADEYGLDYYAAFPGCSTETEPSAATVAFLIDKVKEESIPVVFLIEFSNEKMADTICAETDAVKLLFHSCHNVSPEDIKAGASYLGLMQQNVITLKEALS